MSDIEHDEEYPPWKLNGQAPVKKKRTFQEKLSDDDDKMSPESRSPSPGLPSRLDKIPSPSYGLNKAKSKSPEPKRRDRRDSTDGVTDNGKTKIKSKRGIESEDKKEQSRSRSRSVEKKRRKSETSPKRRRDGRRSTSKSPKRRLKRSRSRSPPRRSPVRRKRSPPRRSPPRRRRSRSHSKERRRRSRSRSRDRRRSPPRRNRNKISRSPRRRRRSRSESRSPPRFTSQWGVSRAVVSDKLKKTKEISTEEVEKRLAEHMKTVQEKAAEEAKKINLPGYLNPAMVNVHQFKQVQDKRKLLWSKPKDKKEGASQWAGAFDDQNSDEKFKRFMGIQGVEIDQESSKVQQSRKVLDDLEKKYEQSRQFQMSRGAGGLTGIGLGFGSAMPPQQ